MASRTEKLNRKGLIAWEVDGVLARLTKAQSQDLEFAIKIQPIVQLGGIVAAHVRDRVQGRGELEGKQPYATQRGWHIEAGGMVPGQVVSQAYADKAALTSTTYASSADLHNAAPKTGVGDVTGTMWNSLQARGSGDHSVIIDFAATSVGHGTGKPDFVKGVPAVGKDGGKGIPVMVRPNENVRNGLKAWTVFNKHGTSPIEPTTPENQAMGEAVTAQAQLDSLRMLDPDGAWQVEPNFGGDAGLRQKLIKGWVR